MHNKVEGRPIRMALHIAIFVSNGELLIWLAMELIMALNLEAFDFYKPPFKLVRIMH